MSDARRQRPLENMAQYYCGVQTFHAGLLFHALYGTGETLLFTNPDNFSRLYI